MSAPQPRRETEREDPSEPPRRRGRWTEERAQRSEHATREATASGRRKAERDTRRAARLLMGNVAGRLGALASLGLATLLVARAGGPQLVGAFTLVRVLPGVVCHLSNCGLPGAAPYFLAAGRHDQARVRPTLALVTVVGALLGGLAWLALSPGLYHLFFESFGWAVVLAAAVPCFTQGFVSVGQRLLQGTDDIRGANWAITVEEVVFLPAYGAALLFWHGPGALISGLVIADVAAAAWIAVRLAGGGFFAGWGGPDPRLAGEICGYGMRGQAGSLLNLLNMRLDVAILGAIAGPASLGVYTVASKFAELLQLPGLAVNYVLYPAFARERDSATRRTRRLLLPTLALSAIGALVLAALTGPVLPRVFSEAFDGAVIPTYILLGGLLGDGITGLIMAYLYGIGRPGITSIAMAAGLAITLGLDLVLIPRHGAIGAAVASAIAYLFTTVLLVIWFERLHRRER